MKHRGIKYIIYSAVILLVLGLSVGFSTLQKQLLIDDFIFNVRMQIDTRVSSSLVSKTSGDAISNFEEYNMSKVYGSVTFPSTSSYVLYKVDVTNYGNTKMGLLNITSNTSGINYSLCDANGNNCTTDPVTEICNGSNCTLGATKELYIKVTSNSTGTKQIDLDLDFEPYHTVTINNYHNLPNGTQYPIMENQVVTLPVYSNVEEFGISGNGIVVYDKTNMTATLSNVTSDVIVTAKYLLTNECYTTYSGTDPDNYVLYGNELYRIITKENVADGYGNTSLRAKITSDSSIGQYIFDNSTNIFANSSLKDVLNTTYYNSLSNAQKELVDTAEWYYSTDYSVNNIGLINRLNFTNNSSWLNKNQFTINQASTIDNGSGGNAYIPNNKIIKTASFLDNNNNDYKVKKMATLYYVYGIYNGVIREIASDTISDTYPTLYLVEDTVVVGGNGTRTNPYLIEKKSDGLQANPTIVTGKTLTVTGSNQDMVEITNKVGTVYIGTVRLNESNYSSSGSTTIPQKKAVGTYTYYYYIPEIPGYKAKSGSVTSRINGITYTVHYSKGDNIASIGTTSDTCTTTGTSLTCDVTLPTITPNSGWENPKWSDGTNQYNPGNTLTLNSTNNETTLTSSVTGKTYTATIYYYNGTSVASTTRTCNVTNGTSCDFTVPSAVSNSNGVYNGEYKGLANTTNTMETSVLTLNDNTTYYAVYSSNVTNYYYNNSAYSNRTLYRNEYFTSNSALTAKLATTNNSTTNYTGENGAGNSTWIGLSTTQDTTPEYNSVESAASSTSNTLYTIYQFSIYYQKGVNVLAIGSTGDTCKITNQTSCDVTLPGVTPNAGYESVGWSTTNGATTGVTGEYVVSTNNLTLYANAIGATYTATFYYYDGTSITTTTNSCTVTNSEGNCTVTVPSVVQNSTGPNNTIYKGVSASTSVMTSSELIISDNNTKFYTNYSSTVTRYYYSSGYKTSTIYRNEYFVNDTTMSSVLNGSNEGTTNYTSSRGPGSSNWLGLSTAQDTTPEYNSVSSAASSTYTTFYTVYQFVLNYEIGANVSAIGATEATCNVTTSDTSCTAILPSITPSTGYTSVGWSLSNGATTGDAPLTVYTITNNNRVLYANAIAANYINTTTNEGYATLNDAFSNVSNNQTIKVLNNTTETTQATLASEKSGIKLDLNGKTVTFNQSYYITNNGELDIYNSSSTNGFIKSNSVAITNAGILTINDTSDSNKVYIQSVSLYDTDTVLRNTSGGTATLNNNVLLEFTNENDYDATRYIVGNNGTLSIDGATIDVGSKTREAGIRNYGSLNMQSGNIYGNLGTATFNNASGGTASILGGTIMGGIAITNYGTLSVSGSATVITSTRSSGILSYASSVLNIIGGTITGKTGGISVTSGSLTIGTNDSTVSTTSPIIQATESGYGLYVSNYNYSFYDGIIKSSAGAGYAINQNPTRTPAGYAVYKETVDGVESATLVEANYQNMTTNKGFLTLNEALNAASSNQTIKVLKDNITDTSVSTLASEKTGIKLDLNGKTITFTQSYYITNNGELDIYNTSETEGVINSENRGIQNNGILTINGTSDLNTVRLSYIEDVNNTPIINNASGATLTTNSNVSFSGWLAYSVKNYGTFTANGTSLTAGSGISNDGTAVFNNVTAKLINNSGTLTINGSSTSITPSGAGNLITNSGTLTINDGTLSNNNNSKKVIDSTGNLYINGGTFYSNNNSSSGEAIYFDGSTKECIITGGKIWSRTNSAITIVSGTLTIGENDSNVSTTSPEIYNQYNTYAVNVTAGATFNFYDGIIKGGRGTNYALSKDPDDIPTSYQLHKETINGVENAYLVKQAILMAGTSGIETTNYLRTTIKKQNIESLTFTNSLSGHTANGTDCWDVSRDSDGTVLAWVVDSDSNGKYEMTIGANGTVYSSSGEYLFAYLKKLNTLNGMNNFDTSNVTNMQSMFYQTGYSSTVFTLDLGNKFDTSQVIYMNNMFRETGYKSTSFTLDLGDKFDTSKVTIMAAMFTQTGYSSTVFTLNLGNKFDTSQVTNMNAMFSSIGYSSTVFTLDLGDKFDTSKVTNMGSMFQSVGNSNTSFTLDLGDKFDTSKVTYMGNMFSSAGYSSTVFTLDLGSKFDTSSVTNMQSMFARTGYSNTVFTLDLGDKFDTSNVTTMYNMFYKTGYSSTVFTLDLGDKFDTSKVTNMEYMFSYTGYSSTVFTLDLGDKFDTSTVTNMSNMFSYTGYSSTAFILNLGDKFDTSTVTNMQYMFTQTGYSSTAFILDLGDKFDTSKVTNMQYMFSQTGYSSTVFTLDLGNKFDTSKVTNMQYMFSQTGYNSTVFILNLGDKFDTSTVTNMQYMFTQTGYSSTVFTLDLGDKFDTSNVTNMLKMFYLTGYNSTVFTLDLGDKFDTSNVTDMSHMFERAGYSSTVFTLDLGDKFDTSNVIIMQYMFSYTGYSSTVFTLDLGNKFDTSTVSNMSYMFLRTGYSSNIFTLNLGNKFDTSNVTNMFSMFSTVGYSNTSFTLDLGSKFDTSNVTSMGSMFANSRYLKTIYAPSTFVTTAVTSSTQMFYGCNSLVGGAGTVYDSNHIDATYAHIDGGTSNPGYFTGYGGILMQGTDGASTTNYLRTNIVKQDIESLTFKTSKSGHTANGTDCWDVSIDEDGSVLAWVTDSNSNGKYEMTIGADGLVHASSGYYLFSNLVNLDSLNGMNNFDTSKVTNMSNMFYQVAFNSTIFTLDLGDKFDTSKVTNMNSMFYYTGHNSTPFTLNLGDKFDTSKVTNMNSMFQSTGSNSLGFTLDLGNKFDTSNVTDMSNMFSQTGYSSPIFTLDLGDKFDTTNVTDMSFMFYGTGNSNASFTLDLGDKYDTSKVTDMSWMFDTTGFYSTIFTLDLGDKFNTSNVTDMSYMFRNTGYSSTNFTLDLGDKFDTSNVINMSGMFSSIACSNTNFNLDLGSRFDTSKVTNMEKMFSFVASNSTIFTLDLGDKFDTSKVTNMNSMFSYIGFNNLNFTLDLGDKFDTSKVTNMSNMFYNSRYLKTIYAPSTFVTTAVTNSSNMFKNCTSLVGGAGTVYDSNHVNASYAHIDGGTSNPGYFYGLGGMLMAGTSGSATTNYLRTNIAKQDIESLTFTNSKSGHIANGTDCWDVSRDEDNSVLAWVVDSDSDGKYEMTIGTDGLVRASSGYYLFSYIENLDSLNGMNNFDTSAVTDMRYMFISTGRNSTTFTLDLGDKFDTSNVTNMGYMFYETGRNNTSFTLNLGNKFDTSNVTNMSDMFIRAGYSSTVFTLDLGDKFDTSKVTDMSYMFDSTGYSSTIFALDLGDKFDTSNVTNMQATFARTCYSNTNFTLDLGDKFDTSKVTNMNLMFNAAGYRSTSFTLDLGDKFDTSAVTDMSYMFSSTGYNSTVFTLDLGDKFDTSNVTNMSRMFYETGYNSTTFTLDLGDKFDTSQVTNMNGMFWNTGRNSTTFTLDLGNKFDTSNVTNMSSMFSYTGYSNTSFTIDLGNKFDTSNVTNMSSMFSYTGYSNTSFTIDLGNKFNTSNVTNMNGMFKGSRYLKTIYAPSSFITTNVTNSIDMFYGCTSLVGGAGTAYSSSHINATYAHIDSASNPGYFTDRATLSRGIVQDIGNIVDNITNSINKTIINIVKD